MEQVAKTKLSAGQKNVLKLIGRDKGLDGWTVVSAQLYKVLSETMPPELATFEPVDDAGRAKLTDAGNSVLESMAWLD